MKLKTDFIVHDSGNESMLIATGEADFSGVVRGNRMLGEVLSLMKEETTEAEIIKKMHERYEASEGVIEKDVNKVITELRKIGAIEGK